MKPLKLSLQAFGPFAGRETVDFTRLPPGALFLIAGPTGAGKTSILDGITYALYGDTSGGERSAREMRSHHADAALQTEVELEFALGGQRYRVRRVPEQTRAAQRGGGMVDAPAKAELFRLAVDDQGSDGRSWQPLAQRTTEVTQQVEALLGFKAEQFRQVVLLPQGQFRKLLAASSAERERILETLFGTAAYKRLQDALKAEAAALRERGEQTRLRRDTLLQQAEAESAETLSARMDALGAALAALEAEEKAAREADAAARAALQQGQAAAARFTEAQAAAAALAVLTAGRAEIDARRQRLNDARRAQQVSPAATALSAARSAAAEAGQRARQAAEAAEQAAEALLRADAALQAEAARGDEREAAQREQMRLEALFDAVARLAEAETALQARQRERTAADARLAQAEAACKALDGQRSQLAGRIDTLQAQAAQAAALGLRVQQAEQREQAQARLAASVGQLKQAQALDEAKRQAFEAAQQHMLRRREAFEALDADWRRAQAAILAYHLHDGGACPVCGSASHPSPARFDGELPTEQALQAARDALRAAEAAMETARHERDDAAQKRAAAQAEVNTRQAALHGGAAADQLQQDLFGSSADEDLPALRTALQAARAAAAEVEQARGQLQQSETALAAAQAALDDARKQATTAASVAEGALRVAEERRGAVPEALRSPQALGTALAAARATRQRLDAALQAAQEAQRQALNHDASQRAQRDAQALAVGAAEARVAEAAAQFADALHAAGFGSAEPDGAEAAWRAAVLPAAQMDALAQQIRSADEQLAAAQARNQRAAQAIAGLTAPDLAALDARATACREQVEAAVARITHNRSEQHKLARTLSLLDEIAREHGAIEAEYRVVGRLAEVANGDNGRNLTFQRYVLAALLDDVLRAASLRLKAMSRGRYLLQRREDVADGRRAAGLDLEVFDDYTGRARPASTLSGGEGFMASLSLALGLSDVVQAYAGGVQLDTLFIDEGFGSLDPESLDMAMRALIDLQQRGRSVGVISHVEDMKQQIGVAIEVVQGVRGSRVRMVGVESAGPLILEDVRIGPASMG
ncbi:AAA family ATPase [Thauera butanivorans]|uniref:AAA family ATPase n=1 Tax=Thauera butanivorans TaxID=86174 RepID=UPI000839AC4A|nr:SMC family ATPase [Thauera butanivorans]